MKKTKIALLILIVLINSILITGCWNYKEVDKLAIVAGVAIDKGINAQFQMTVEIIQISSGKDSKMSSKTITMEGNTIFDAARNIISLTGKRLYWSHAKVIILSKEIASEGIIRVIDWYNRDSETREDVSFLISEAKTAKEIFSGQGTTEDIKSFTLGEMIENQDSLSKSPKTDILHLDNQMQFKGMSAVVPAVKLIEVDKKMVPQIMGSAIIKRGKLVGFLNGEETKDLGFIRDDVKGGLIIQEMKTNDIPPSVSLEIFKSKTKVTPEVDGNDIKIKLEIKPVVAIGEITGTENFIDDEGQEKLKNSAENELKKRIETLIKKMQSEYDADIFGFGAKLSEDNSKVWKRVSNNWEYVFKDLLVNVKVKINIKNSGMLSKSLKKGE